MRKAAMIATAAMAAWLPLGAAAQDGQALFRRSCGGCHAVAPGQNRIGPTLAGIAGKPAAAVPGFAYSDALKNAHVTWSDDLLEKYVMDPKGTVPGTQKSFAGVKDPADAKAIVDYLKTLK